MEPWQDRDRYNYFDYNDIRKLVKSIRPGFQMSFEAYEICTDFMDCVVSQIIDQHAGNNITIVSLSDAFDSILLDTLKPIVQEKINGNEVPHYLSYKTTRNVMEDMNLNMTVDDNIAKKITVVLEYLITRILEPCVQTLIERSKKRISGEMVAAEIDNDDELAFLFN
jgi:hypothetical protein